MSLWYSSSPGQRSENSSRMPVSSMHSCGEYPQMGLNGMSAVKYSQRESPRSSMSRPPISPM